MPRETVTEPASRPEHRGLHFDDFQLGARFRSGCRTISEADILAFAGLSGDFNPLHTDEEFARKTIFRGRIAHGLLIQSISSGLASQTGIFEGTTVAAKEMVIHFLAPVAAGDTIRVELIVVGLDDSPSRKRGWVRFQTLVRNQRDEMVIDGTWVTLLARRSGADLEGAL